MNQARILTFALIAFVTSAQAARPAWYGSGCGPAMDAVAQRELAKFHPFAGGRGIFVLEHSKHRYSRARLALASEPRLPPAPPSRYASIRCIQSLLGKLRALMIAEGPTTEVSDIVDFRDPALMTYRYEVDPQMTFLDPEMTATLYHGVGALHLSHAGVTAAWHDLLVLIGPVIPGTAAGYVDSRNQLFELAGELFIPNWEAFYWADTVISQMNWGDLEAPFSKPTLILVGEHDTDVPESTLRWLERQAARFDHVHFHRIPGAGHNVLRGGRDYDPTEAFAIIHRFLRQHGAG